jgi:hypothetical protein
MVGRLPASARDETRRHAPPPWSTGRWTFDSGQAAPSIPGSHGLARSIDEVVAGVDAAADPGHTLSIGPRPASALRPIGHDLTRPAVSRMQESAAPAPVATPRTFVQAPRPAGAGADPVAVALATGLGHVDADGAVVFSATSESPRPTLDVQRAASSVTPPPAAEVTGGAATSTPGPDTDTEPVEEGGQTQDLEQLARDLWVRLRPRLRRELSLDRERAGYPTDVRM